MKKRLLSAILAALLLLSIAPVETVFNGLGLVSTVAKAIDYVPYTAEEKKETLQTMKEILYGGAGGYGMTCDFDGYQVMTAPDGKRARHEGIDFQFRAGENCQHRVYSLIEGTVVYAGGGSCNHIGIYDNIHDVTVLYLHTAMIQVAIGDHVSVGDWLAMESNSGTSAIHTHVEVVNGEGAEKSSLGNSTLENDDPYPYWIKKMNATKSQAINESNSKININNCTIPNTINQGTAFEALSGTISTNDSNGLFVLYATIADCNKTVVQKSLVVPSLTNGPFLTLSKVYSYSFEKLCTNKSGTIDFSKLQNGTYTLQLFVACAPKAREFNILGLFNTKAYLNSDYIKRSNEYEFSVSDGAKTAQKAPGRAANGRALQYDKNGNSYYTVSCIIGERSAGGSYAGNGVSSVGNSYYDASASYPTGTYVVRANGGLNARSQPTANSARISGWPNGSVIEVTATNGNWGYTSRGWVCLNYAVYQTPPAATYVAPVHYNVGAYEVATEAGLHVRQGSGPDYNVIRTLANGTRFNVDETNGAWGFSKKLGGWLNLSYASYVGDPEAELPTPEAPAVTSTAASEIPVGEIITVRWNRVEGADWYVARLTDAKSGEAVQTLDKLTGTEAAFATPYAGTFNVGVTAANSQHSSHEAAVCGIEAKAPVHVTFKDWDGRVISTQEVTFGKDAAAPAAPARAGHTFKEWSGSFKNVREDVTITAAYTRNSYDVTFYDFDGTVLNTQKILYEDAAAAPAYTAPDGYTFVRWDRDFGRITENTGVTAVLTWSGEYPLEIDSVSKIVRNNKMYVTTAIVNNSPNAVSDAKLLMALKTAENKQLAYVESAAFSMAAGERKTVNLSVEYDGASTVGNLFVVKNDDEKIPLSNSLTVAVDQGTAWSAWSTSAPPSDALRQESRKEYSYREKEFTTSTASSLSGWTKRTDVTNPTTSYGGWSGWSAWQDSAVSGSDVREVQTQTVWNGYSGWSGWSDWQDGWVGANDYTQVETRNVNDAPIYETRYGYTTYYNYYRYANRNADTGGQGSYAYSSSYPYYRTYKLTSRLTECDNNYAKTRYHYWYSSSNWVGVYACDPLETSEATSSWQELTGYTQKTQYRYRTRTDTYKTQYRYRTRTKTVTYYYWRWKTWSDWGTTAYAAASDREVQSRTTYRYISNAPGNIEDATGVSRTVSGTVDADLFAGKHAILYVSSADGAAQFIGQTKIGADGAYSFTFKLKNDPTAASGDYGVRLSIEGTNAAMALDPIPAPEPLYTVTFRDWDGTVLSTQEVRKGENADIPEAPDHEGYKFVKWSKTPTNVVSDLDVTAVYAVRTYGVVFMDDLNGTKELRAFSYGEPLETPETAAPEGYVFLGWSVAAGTEVTENLVVYARYERETFEVRFLDYEGSEISVQPVEYGEPAIAPTLEDRDGCVFLGWEIPYDIGYVTASMTVKPRFEYETAAETPVVNVETGAYTEAQTVTLSTGTAWARIYYTTDGSYPLDPADGASPSRAPGGAKKTPAAGDIRGTLYTGPFTLDDSAVLTAVAVKDGMNASACAEKTYAINTASATEKRHLVTIHYGLYDSVYTVLVKENETVFDGEPGFWEGGYTLAGVYADAAMTRAWDLETDKVTDSTDLYLKWEKNAYAVTFLDKDGGELAVRTVSFGEDATPPAPASLDGFLFAGWDRDYTNVCEDVTVRAVYVPASDVTSVVLGQKELVLREGEAAALTAAVSTGKGTDNDRLIWQSDDERVVTVDDTGTIAAVGAGTATVYAVSEDSGLCDACTVYVEANGTATGGGNGDGNDVSGGNNGSAAQQSNCVCGKYHAGPLAGVLRLCHKIVWFFKNIFVKN